MGQKKVIFAPSNKQMKQMLEKSWQEFLKQAREAGYNISEDSAEGWIMDAFVGGYCYGWNDGYGIIRGQLEADDLEQKMMEN